MTNTAAVKTSKTDQVKTAIMAELNSQESATRKELHDICSTISSARTITRALASLKLDGRINQIKTGNDFSWISLESPTPETKKADPKPETKKAGKLNQTDQIRAYIKSGKSHKSMIQGLAKAFDKKETWAKSRIATYEKAYGNMGINDPKMAK